MIETLAMDGKTTGAEAALAVIAAERGKTSAAAAAQPAAAPRLLLRPRPSNKRLKAAAGCKAPAGYKVDEGAAALDAKAKAYMKANPGTDYLAAVRAVEQMEA